ncbi:MAG: methyltransferase domain-containing protein [Chloroflexi bacterium]|nr:methyltransferase domain-containing protein [Chloroflexota bacterium]
MPTESNPQDQADDLRDALVAELVRQGAIRNSAVRDTFATVPRHLFVPQADLATAYGDQPVFIRWDAETPISSSTQPTMMAIMIEQLCLEPGNRVLEIGAGSGYNAAIMAHIVGDTGNVVTVDIDQDIVDEAAANLSQTGFHNVTCVCGDGFEGVPTKQPYDRIIVTVGAYDVSPHWVNQLKDGGILVVPLWFRGANLSVALRKQGSEITGLSASPCTFIPIRGIWQRTEGYYPVGDPPDEALQMAIALDSDDAAYRRELGQVFNQSAELREIGRSLDGQYYTQNIYSGLFMFLTAHPDVYNVYSSSESGPFQGAGYGLIDLDTMSAAVLSDHYPDKALVYGNDVAYEQLLDLLEQWDELGHPAIHNLSIRALYEAPGALSEGEWTIAKRSIYTWVMSWRAATATSCSPRSLS